MPPDRILDRIDATGPCWLWQGATQPNGYGRVWHDGAMRYAHRHMWEALVGPIPEGMEVDHLCRVRHCCNPDHLEIVSHAENKRRGRGNQHTGKTHCVHGHEFTPENTRYRRDNGTRQCRACSAPTRKATP